MRLRYRSVTYRYMQGSPQELERQHHQLWHELVRQSQPLSPLHHSSIWRPPADIHETDNAITVKIELAGMRESELDVTLYRDALVVSGERPDHHEHEEEAICYHEAQIRYGPFRIEIVIPNEVDHAQVKARYDDGFLQVLLPKKVPAPPKQLGSQAPSSSQKQPEREKQTPTSGETNDSPHPRHYHAPISGPLVVGAKGDAPHA